MKKTLTAIAAMTIASSAFATYCSDGSTIESHPNGNCNYVPPKADPVQPLISIPVLSPSAAATSGARSESESRAAAEARQRQEQAQRQAQEQAQRNDQRQTNAQRTRQTTSTSADGNGAGSGIVTIQGAQPGSGAVTNVRESTVFVPAQPTTQAAIAMPGPIASYRTEQCGPLKIIVRTPMYAIHRGPFGGESEIYQGDHYEAPDMIGSDGFTPVGFRRVQLSDTETILYGHRKVYSRTVLTGSSVAHLNVAGWGSSGNGGSAGGGGSGAVTKFGTEVDLEDCEMGRVKRLALPRIGFSPAMMPVVYRPKPKPKCVTETVMAPKAVCVAKRA